MFLVSLLFSLALCANNNVVWNELDLVYSDVSKGLKLALEADVFNRLDVDNDGTLSGEEWRLFLESALFKTLGDITEADMLEMKQNLVYPVFEITEDMDAAHVARVCSVVRQLEEMDLVQEFERSFNDDPYLFQKALLELFGQAPITFTGKSLVKFDAYLEKVKQRELYSKELRIPEECKELNVPTKRRRTFGSVGKFLGDMASTLINDTPAAIVSTGVAAGAWTGHMVQHCTFGDNSRCNTDSAGAISSEAGYASFNCVRFGWDCSW